VSRIARNPSRAGRAHAAAVTGHRCQAEPGARARPHLLRRLRAELHEALYVMVPLEVVDQDPPSFLTGPLPLGPYRVGPGRSSRPARCSGRGLGTRRVRWERGAVHRGEARERLATRVDSDNYWLSLW
jgi:hypothetical protein